LGYSLLKKVVKVLTYKLSSFCMLMFKVWLCVIVLFCLKIKSNFPGLMILYLCLALLAESSSYFLWLVLRAMLYLNDLNRGRSSEEWEGAPNMNYNIKIIFTSLIYLPEHHMFLSMIQSYHSVLMANLKGVKVGFYCFNKIKCQ